MAFGAEQAPRAPTRQLGMFERYGLPQPGSQGRLAASRKKEDSALFENMLQKHAAALPANDRGVFQAFARLGRNLGGGAQGGVSPEEQQQFEAVDTAQRRIQELRNNPSFSGLSPQEQAFRVEQELARSLMDTGDVATGAQILRDAAERRQKAMRAELELSKLESQVEAMPEDQEASRMARERAAAGEWGTFAVGEPGETLVSPDRDVRTVTGRMRPDGSVETQDGETFINHMDVNTAQQLRKNMSGTEDLSPLRLFHNTLGTSERQSLREQDAAVREMGNIVQGIGQGFRNLMELGEDPGQIVGTTGALVNFSRNVVDTVKSSMSAFRFNQPVVDEDGNVITHAPSTQEGTNRLLDRFGSLIVVPEGVVPEERSRYQAAVMQLAYADARMQEGGNRLSDQDIRNALQRLGTDQADPRRVASTLVANLSQRARAMDYRVQQVRGIGESIPGLGGSRAMRNVFGRDDISTDIQNAVESVDDLFRASVPLPPGARSPVTGQPVREQPAPAAEDSVERELQELMNLPPAL